MVLDLLPGTSGGYEDCYTSRSFALVILHDALHEAAFYARDAAEGARLDRKADRAPLTKALEKAGKGWRESPEWMAANVDRYVVSTEVVGRWNELGEQRLRRREMEIQKKMMMAGGIAAALPSDRATAHSLTHSLAHAQHGTPMRPPRPARPSRATRSRPAARSSWPKAIRCSRARLSARRCSGRPRRTRRSPTASRSCARACSSSPARRRTSLRISPASAATARTWQ